MARVKQFKTIDEQIDILKDKGLDPKQYAPSYIRNRISFIKNEMLSDAEITRFFLSE